MSWSATPTVKRPPSGWTDTPAPEVNSVPGWSGRALALISAPAMDASADMPTPVARLDVPTLWLPASARMPSPTVRLESKPAPLAASARMPTPTVKLEIIAPSFGAVASMPVPLVDLRSDIVVTAPPMDADAHMPTPAARLGVSPPAALASAVMPVPSVKLALAAPAMPASAQMPNPAVRLGIPAPVMSASAVMPAPQIQLQPAYGATGTAFVSTSTKTTSGSLTIACTVGDVVLVYLSGETSAAESPISVSSGETVTQRAVQPYNNNSSAASLRCYSFQANSTATKTINYAGSFPSDVEIQAVSYPGVANIGASTTAYGATAASAQISPTTQTLERVVVAFGSDQSNGQFVPSGGTNRWNSMSTTSGSNYLTPLAISDGNGGTYSVSSTGVGNWSAIATILSGV
jgi:hypothetical protein